MPYCIKCLAQIKENDTYCFRCGSEVNKKQSCDNEEKLIHRNNKKLSLIGYIIGLITFIISFIPYIGIISFFVAPAGIIICSIAKEKSTTSIKAVIGLKFSIWGTILGIVMFYVNILIIKLLFFIIG